MNTLLRWMYNWASDTSTRDALGHLFRVTVAPNADLITEALGGATSGDHRSAARRRPATAARPRAVPSIPAPSVAAPATQPTAPGTPAGPITKLQQTLGQTVSAVGALLNKVTGGSAAPPSQPPQHSLSALLNYLLGR
jgi:hypothetical protein